MLTYFMQDYIDVFQDENKVQMLVDEICYFLDDTSYDQINLDFANIYVYVPWKIYDEVTYYFGVFLKEGFIYKFIGNIYHTLCEKSNISKLHFVNVEDEFTSFEIQDALSDWVGVRYDWL